MRFSCSSNPTRNEGKSSRSRQNAASRQASAACDVAEDKGAALATPDGKAGSFPQAKRDLMRPGALGLTR